MSKHYNSLPFLLIFVSLIIIILTAGCKELIVSSHWISQPVTIDGQIDDWGDLPVSYFKDQDAVVAVCNDSSRLYLQFRTKNADWARTIKMSGLTVYVDNQGKKNKDFYLKFTGGPDNPLFHGLQGNDSVKVRQDIPPEMRDRIKNKKPELICFDKKRYLDKQIPMSGSEGPAVGFGSEYGFYIYEFSVPLHKSTVNDYGIEATPGQKMSIGLVWGDKKDFRKNNKPHDFNSGEGMRGEGGEGGEGFEGGGLSDRDEPIGGGRPPESGRMPGRGGQFKRPEKQEIWLNTTLALITNENSEHK